MSESETSQEQVEAEEEGEEVTAQKVDFGEIGAEGSPGQRQNLDLLLDVPISVTVEVGRSEMDLDGVLNLGPGSLICLEKKAEDPVDLRVNGKLIARGEVVMVDDHYGLRVTQILEPTGRIESLRGG